MCACFQEVLAKSFLVTDLFFVLVAFNLSSRAFEKIKFIKEQKIKLKETKLEETEVVC